MTLVLFLSSCATIFNSSKTTLNVYTNQPTKLIVANDTSKNTSTVRTITVGRNKNELKLVIFNDSLQRTLNIKPFSSFAYWANLGFYYGLGMLVDLNNPKRYGYPKMVYVDLEDNTNEYLPYIPINSMHDHYWNILKFTPLKLLGITNPAFELSYERRTAPSFSTQLMVSYLLPRTVWDFSKPTIINMNGFRTALEEKFYFRKSAPFGPYLGLEFDYLTSRYDDIRSFSTISSQPDQVSIKKENYSLNFKFGYQLITKQLSFDCFMGLGLRYKNVKHLNSTNNNGNNDREPPYFNMFYNYSREGKYTVLSMPLNVRVGWTF